MRKIKCVNPSNPQAHRVYMVDGLTIALYANGGGQGGKTGLYLVSDMDKKVIDKNFTEVEDGKYVTTTRERENCYAVTTRPRDRPLHKKQDNHVVEKEVKPVLTPDRINKRQNGRRMKDDGEPMFTLTAQDKHGIYDGMTVRKLTPKECERLQAFPDDWTKYGKDGELISDTQRYKCCGNAVTTNVITAIVDEMFDKVIK